MSGGVLQTMQVLENQQATASAWKQFEELFSKTLNFQYRTDCDFSLPHVQNTGHSACSNASFCGDYIYIKLGHFMKSGYISDSMFTMLQHGHNIL